MIDFKPITPKEHNLFKKYYSFKADNAENSFANLCAYSFLYKGEYALLEDTLLTRIHFEYNKQICYYMPMGKMPLKDVVNLLIQDSKEQNYQLNFVVEDETPFKEFFPDMFHATTMRDAYDYLYLRIDLANLSGKKYQSKRNHINKFCNLYSYKFKTLTASDKEECMQMLERWRKQEMNISPSFKRDYDDEYNVINYLFDNFNDLEMFGGAIMVENLMVAFSLGSAVNERTFDTNIEKADRDYMGSYALINREMAIHLPDNFQFINREEDKGIFGLRKAKLSYHPYKMIVKTILTFDS